MTSRSANLLIPKYRKVNSRRAFLVGDSMTQNGNYAQTITAASASNGTLTYTTSAGHGCDVGSYAYMGGFTNEVLNGLKQAASITNTTIVNFNGPRPISLTGAGSSLSMVLQSRITDRNWLALASYINNGNFDRIFNFGLSGNKVAQISRRLTEHVLPFVQAGDLVQIHGSFNDFQSQAAADAPAIFEALKLEYAGMIETCLENDLIPLVVSPFPFDSGATGYNATCAQYMRNLGRYLHDLCHKTYPEAMFLDVYPLCVVYDTGNWLTNYNISDKIHPTSLACHKIAQVLAPMLAERFGSRKQARASSLVDVPATNPASTQIHPNPVNNGTGGTIAGAGNSGSFVPDGMTCTLTRTAAATNVNSRSLRSDGRGYNYIATFTSDAANDQLDFVTTTSMHSYVSAGEKVFAEVELTMSSIVNIDKIEFGFETTANGLTVTAPKAIESLAACKIVDNFTILLRTPELIIPASLTSLKLRMRIRAVGAGGAVIQQALYSVNKVAA